MAEEVHARVMLEVAYLSRLRVHVNMTWTQVGQCVLVPAVGDAVDVQELGRKNALEAVVF